MESHRVLQETAYPSLAYGLFGLGRFLQQIPDSYKRVIFMSICGSIWLSLDTPSQVAEAQDVSNDSQFCFHRNLNKPHKINGLENHKKLLAFAFHGISHWQQGEAKYGKIVFNWWLCVRNWWIGVRVTRMRVRVRRIRGRSRLVESVHDLVESAFENGGLCKGRSRCQCCVLQMAASKF